MKIKPYERFYSGVAALPNNEKPVNTSRAPTPSSPLSSLLNLNPQMLSMLMNNVLPLLSKTNSNKDTSSNPQAGSMPNILANLKCIFNKNNINNTPPAQVNNKVETEIPPENEQYRYENMFGTPQNNTINAQGCSACNPQSNSQPDTQFSKEMGRRQLLSKMEAHQKALSRLKKNGN